MFVQALILCSLLSGLSGTVQATTGTAMSLSGAEQGISGVPMSRYEAVKKMPGTAMSLSVAALPEDEWKCVDSMMEKHKVELPEDEWKWADSMAEKHRDEWYEVFRDFGLDPYECEAVVFPELLRYSRFQDGAQTAALMSLYVSGGRQKSNYSVGYFQMKPSFLEEVEAAWMESSHRYEYEIFFPRGERRDIRQRRVERLREAKWQCVYLSMFILLYLDREPSLKEMEPEKRVRYLATAYNFSFTAERARIEKRMSMKHFHLNLVRLEGTPVYNYSELAAERYSELTTK